MTDKLLTKTFCTIITPGYAPYALALFKSLQKFDEEISIQVLVTDHNNEATGLLAKHRGIFLYFPADILDYGLAGNIYKKYAHINQDSFRWALKPVFISYLLENGFEKVIFTDCDIYFYDPFQFLFDELNVASILLTPHWRNADPLVDETSFFALFTGGIFNAGFIGANKNGLPALSWWAEACHFRMGPLLEFGIHDDQRYLDVLPVNFENVQIVRHKGCNLGAWNQLECRRLLTGNKVLINGIYPIVFIHFNPVLIKEILKGHDKLLLPYLEEYKQTFEASGEKLSHYNEDLEYYFTAGKLAKLKWNLKLKTRVKALLYKLAKSL